MFVGLGHLPGGTSSVALGVSADGSIVVGERSSALGDEAFRWTSDGGMVGLGMPEGAVERYAMVVSADGSVIVVIGYDAQLRPKGFLWDEASGMRRLDEVLTELGLGPQIAGWTPSEARGITPDGTVVVGWGVNPNGQAGAFLVKLPEPGSGAALLVGAGVLFGLAVRSRRASERARDAAAPASRRPVVPPSGGGRGGRGSAQIGISVVPGAGFEPARWATPPGMSAINFTFSTSAWLILYAPKRYESTASPA